MKLTIDNGAGFDVETYLVQPGLLAPPLVLGSVAEYVDEQSGIQGLLLDKEDALRTFVALLDSDKVIVGANIAFDLLVCATELAKRGYDAIPGIFRALDEGRIMDVQIAEALDAVANGHLNLDPRNGNQPLRNPDTGKRGRYSLATCVDLVLGRTDSKENAEYRLRYAEFDNVPLDQLPQESRDYPVDDTVNVLEVGLAQAGHLPKVTMHHRWGGEGRCLDCDSSSFGSLCNVRRPHRNLHDLSAQVATAFAMHLGAAWGFRVNQASVDIIERHALRNRERGIRPFMDAGLVRADGTEDRSLLKKRVVAAYQSDATTCPVCRGTGKVPSPKNPKSKIICFSLGTDDEKIKTCDGTGIVLGAEVPRSEKEGIGYGRDVLHSSGDDFLMSYGDFQEDAKDLNVYVPYLRQARIVAGDGWRDIPLTLRPNVILETGRTSYDGVIQLFKRQPGHTDTESGEWVPSLRECIQSRPGYFLSSVDYEGGELVTHAQSCKWIVGYSDLGDALNAGVKPHNALGATMIGLDYQEFERRFEKGDAAEKLGTKHARQTAKAANFGFSGALGPPKLVLQQRKQGPDTICANGPALVKDDDGKLVRGYKGLRFCILMDGADRCGIKKVTSWKDRDISPTCEACIIAAARLRDIWFKQWSENRKYFQIVADWVEQGQLLSDGTRLGPGEIQQHVSNRIRGGVTFTSAANGFFQGLLADLAKSALRRVSRECYDHTVRVATRAHENSVVSAYAGGGSPLLGSRVVMFAHDEIITEVPESVSHDASMRVSEIMVEEFMHYCPDLAAACRAEPALMRVWSKAASPRYDDNKRLIPWSPHA